MAIQTTSKATVARALWRTSAQAAVIAALLCIPLTLGVMEWRPLAVIIVVIAGSLSIYYAKKSTESPSGDVGQGS